MKSPSEIANEITLAWDKACIGKKGMNYHLLEAEIAEAIESERKRAEGLREALKNLVALCWKQVLFPKTYRAFNDAESTLSSYEGREEGKENL